MMWDKNWWTTNGQLRRKIANQQELIQRLKEEDTRGHLQKERVVNHSNHLDEMRFHLELYGLLKKEAEETQLVNPYSEKLLEISQGRMRKLEIITQYK